MNQSGFHGSCQPRVLLNVAYEVRSGKVNITVLLSWTFVKSSLSTVQVFGQDPQYIGLSSVSMSKGSIDVSRL